MARAVFIFRSVDGCGRRGVLDHERRGRPSGDIQSCAFRLMLHRTIWATWVTQSHIITLRQYTSSGAHQAVERHGSLTKVGDLQGAGHEHHRGR